MTAATGGGVTWVLISKKTRYPGDSLKAQTILHSSLSRLAL